MIRYIEKTDVIYDRDNDLVFGKNDANPHYQEYLAWVAGGNTPIPEKPGPEYILVDDAWEIDADLQNQQEVIAANNYLAETDLTIKRYNEDIEAGRRPTIPASKYKTILKKRARAHKTAVV